MGSSVESRAGRRRTAPEDGHQKRPTTRPELIARAPLHADWANATTYCANVTPEEVAVLVESLPQVKRKGTADHPAWYVHDRLVARLLDPVTLLIRVPLSRREALLAAHPASFGVPPRFEAHHKVEAYLDRAERSAISTAIELAWDMQRRP
jgi:hypothetical protein